jgi:hypothetical protein
VSRVWKALIITVGVVCLMDRAQPIENNGGRPPEK